MLCSTRTTFVMSCIAQSVNETWVPLRSEIAPTVWTPPNTQVVCTILTKISRKNTAKYYLMFFNVDSAISSGRSAIVSIIVVIHVLLLLYNNHATSAKNCEDFRANVCQALRIHFVQFPNNTRILSAASEGYIEYNYHTVLCMCANEFLITTNDYRLDKKGNKTWI